jgi:hypothetical protein
MKNAFFHVYVAFGYGVVRVTGTDYNAGGYSRSYLCGAHIHGFSGKSQVPDLPSNVALYKESAEQIGVWLHQAGLLTVIEERD